MKQFLLYSTAIILSALSAHADALKLKNGTSIQGYLQGYNNQVIFILPYGSNDANKELRQYPFESIAEIVISEPDILNEASGLFAQDKPKDVFEALKEPLKKADLFPKVANNFKYDLLLIKAKALIYIGDYKNTFNILNDIEKNSSDSSVVKTAQTMNELVKTLENKNHNSNVSTVDSLSHEIDAAKRNDITQITASHLIQGIISLNNKESVKAIKHFLSVPLFLSEETIFVPVAQYYAAQTYQQMKDYPRAISTLEELIQVYPNHTLSKPSKDLLKICQTALTVEANPKK